MALANDNPYNAWVVNSGVGLGIYAQLQHCFGWEFYKQVFAHYEALAETDQPKGNENQIAYWIEQCSKVANYNLSPLFEFWGFTVQDSVKVKLNLLPPFLPDDEMTQLAPHRVEMIQMAYPELVRA